MPLDTITYINNWVIIGGRFSAWKDDEFGVVLAYHDIGSLKNSKPKFVANHQTLMDALDELASRLREESETPETTSKKKIKIRKKK